MAADADESARTAARVERLWAIHEIQQLAYGYAHAFALRDRELMLSLWADTEAPVRLPALDGHRLRHDLDRWWQTLGTVLLHVTNHVIEFDDEASARGSVHCLGQIDLGHQFVDQTILYRDRYVRQDGRWLFATREHLLWFGQERERHPFRQPPARWPRRQVGRGVLADQALAL
jgi:SnoaL-like domain